MTPSRISLRTGAFVLGLLAASNARAGGGEEVFANYCAPCHGLDGKARTPAGKKAGAKDLSESKLADAAIETQIRDGTKNKNGSDRMPAFKDRLTPDQIAQLVAFVKTFRR